MAIFFQLTKSYKKSTMKFIVAVDDFRSYDLISQFIPYYKIFKENMIFEIHLKIFKKVSTTFLKFKENDCVGKNKKEFCSTASYEDSLNVKGLSKETLK